MTNSTIQMGLLTLVPLGSQDEPRVMVNEAGVAFHGNEEVLPPCGPLVDAHFLVSGLYVCFFFQGQFLHLPENSQTSHF